MRTIALVISICFLLLGCASQPVVKKDLMPGLTYYSGNEALTGKLVFLVSRNADEVYNGTNAAAIYEFDLASQELKRLTDAPTGRFIASKEGELYGVIYWNGVWGQEKYTNIFLYSQDNKQVKTTFCTSPPVHCEIIEKHLFFCLEERNTPFRVTELLMDYDFTNNQTKLKTIPGDELEPHGNYSMLSKSIYNNRELLFYFSPNTKKKIKTTLKIGFYKMNIESGRVSIAGIGEINRNIKSADGNYVYFEDGGALEVGCKFVSSSKNYNERRDQKFPKNKDVKLLHDFSGGSAIGDAVLQRLSPCGHYAFVMMSEPARSKLGWCYTYYLVDLSTGNTRVLIKDTAERIATGRISQMVWVDK